MPPRKDMSSNQSRLTSSQAGARALGATSAGKGGPSQSHPGRASTPCLAPGEVGPSRQELERTLHSVSERHARFLDAMIMAADKVVLFEAEVSRSAQMPAVPRESLWTRQVDMIPEIDRLQGGLLKSLEDMKENLERHLGYVISTRWT
jgi:hypothetical protein